MKSIQQKYHCFALEFRKYAACLQKQNFDNHVYRPYFWKFRLFILFDYYINSIIPYFLVPIPRRAHALDPASKNITLIRSANSVCLCAHAVCDVSSWRCSTLSTRKTTKRSPVIEAHSGVFGVVLAGKKTKLNATTFEYHDVELIPEILN